jgi:DNA/RNA-binding protein KIN17
MQILSTSFKTNRSKLLDVYQVMIDDPHHVHLNATKWEGEIEEYAKYLGRNSFCKVEQTPEGLYVTWIDRSMTVMNKEMAIEKKKTVEVSEQQREMQELERQIKRAERSLETSISTASSILAPQDKKIKIELKSSSVKPNPLKRKPLK